MSSRRQSGGLGRLSEGGGGTNGKENVGQGSNNSNAIEVCLRLRPPLNSLPKSALQDPKAVPKLPEVFRITDNDKKFEVHDTFDVKSFLLDKIFSFESTQDDVFKKVEGCVKSVMEGFNGTVLAYGQTSSGKTYTIEGPNLWDPESQGIISRSINCIFETIAASATTTQWQVSVSYFEIYCEKIRDLLNPVQDNLKMRETKNGGLYIADISEQYCADKESVLRLVEAGKANRASAPTLMNAESSRSHSILSLLINQKNEETGRVKKGKLYLVDLAGSEKISKTGASGARLEEAKNINSSLTTLGMVINALSKAEGSSHIPYRDSKLTRLLMDSLGGNSKTTLIICCSTDREHITETLSTLRFGERAKKVQNNARINEEISMEELKAMLAAAKKEIEILKRKLAKALAGIADSPEGMTTTANLTNTESDSLAGTLTNDESNNNTRDSLLASPSADSLADTSTPSRPATPFDMEKEHAELIRLQKAITHAEFELEHLKDRNNALEEELEGLRNEVRDEREKRMNLNAEKEALQTTVTVLEAKVLELTLEAKNLSSGGGGGGVSPPGSPSRSNTISQSSMHESLSTTTMEGTPLKSAATTTTTTTTATTATPHEKSDEVRDPSASSSLDDVLIDGYIGNDNNNKDNGKGKGEGEDNGKGNDTAVVSDSVASAANATAEQEKVGGGGRGQGLKEKEKEKEKEEEESKREKEREKEKEVESQQIAQLRMQSEELTMLLEGEIKALESTLSSREFEARSAQASATIYAEKYIHLREKYEAQVQKLMLRLTHEQQARQHVEDRLEDAMRRLWMQSEANSNSSWLSYFTGSKGNDTSTKGMTSKELSLARALELSEGKVAQLTSELEANREAQAIVLETKETVMRSLVRQNTLITHERDALLRRADDLGATVDQLTNLLRSLQMSKKVSSNSNSSTTSAAAITIQGGTPMKR